MQMMVENQGQTLDQIESSASEVHNDVEKGNDHISKAIVIARSTRAVSF
jgi:syntaxin 1B/2/3